MKSSIPLSLVTVQKGSYHIIITASVQGKDVRMLVDTGASSTVFDKTRMELSGFLFDEVNMKNQDIISAGVGSDSLDISMIKLNNFYVGDWSIKTFKTVIMDLSHANNTFISLGFMPIDGILGGDLLMRLKSVIDYKRKILVINFRKR